MSLSTRLKVSFKACGLLFFFLMFELDLVSLKKILQIYYKTISSCSGSIRATTSGTHSAPFCLTAFARTQTSVWEQNPGSYNLEFIVFFRDPLNLGELGHIQVKPRPILYSFYFHNVKIFSISLAFQKS